MTVTLDWLGCATFRLRIDDLTLYLDAYVDRVAGAPSVGTTVDEIDVADYVLVGHSHFDHLAGAEVIAANTGANGYRLDRDGARHAGRGRPGRATLANAGRRALPAVRQRDSANLPQPALLHLDGQFSRARRRRSRPVLSHRGRAVAGRRRRRDGEASGRALRGAPQGPRATGGGQRHPRRGHRLRDRDALRLHLLPRHLGAAGLAS